MKNLSVKECLSFGWRTFKARPGIFALSTLLIFAISYLANVIENLAQDYLVTAMVAPFGAITGLSIAFVLSFVINTLIGAGYMLFYLRAHQSPEAATIRNLWNPKPFWNFLGTDLIVGLAVVLGLFLLVVPGVIFSLVLAFATLCVVDRGMNPVQAINESARLTRGHRWQLFLLMLAAIGINIVGTLALGVGLLVSLPVTTLAYVHAYRQMTNVTA